MAGYDAGGLIMTASTSDDILRLSGPDNGREMLGAMDAFDHDLNFEGDGLLYVSRPHCNRDATHGVGRWVAQMLTR
jgi:hypothetical protein